MKWFAALFSSQDKSADTINFGGLASLFVLFCMTGWDVVKLGHAFAAVTFAGACGVILGAIAGGRRLRDGLQQPGAQQ